MIAWPDPISLFERRMSAKQTMRLVALSVAVFGLLGLGTVHAGSLNMTGTWEGFTACDELKGGIYP